MNKKFWLPIVLLVFVACLTPIRVEAADAKVTTDTLLQYFEANMTGWEPTLRGYANTIFWTLASIELA